MSESQGAKLSCRTLRSSAVAGCDVQVSHPAMFFLTILRKSGGNGKVDANVFRSLCSQRGHLAKGSFFKGSAFRSYSVTSLLGKRFFPAGIGVLPGMGV